MWLSDDKRNIVTSKMRFPTIEYESQLTREQFDLIYAPQGNETVSWNDPRLSTIELDFNGQVMTELLFDFSNSHSFVGISPDSMQAT